MLNAVQTPSTIGANARTIITASNSSANQVVYTVPANKKFVGSIMERNQSSYAQYVEIQPNGTGSFFQVEVSNYGNFTLQFDIVLTAGTVVRGYSNMVNNAWQLVGVESDA